MGNQDNDICTLHPFERNRYFYGKLLTVRDFEIEQSYSIGKDALINRIIHGGGIVCGLEVTGNPQEKDQILSINLSAGVGIDCCGHEIVVSKGGAVEVVGQIQEGSNYLYLKYKECCKEPVPCLANASTCDETCTYNRIKEIYEVIVGSAPNAGKVKITGAVSESDGTTHIKSAIIEALQNGVVKGCAMTGSDGQYELFAPSGMKYDIRASASGFKIQEFDDVQIDNDYTQSFTLDAEAAPDPKVLKSEISQEYYEKYLKTCCQCADSEDAKVFLAAIDKAGAAISINNSLTSRYRVILPNNPMLYKLLNTHIADFNNPHYTSAKQLGALKSINNVGNTDSVTYVSNIDLVSDDNTLNIVPDPVSDNKQVSLKLAQNAVERKHLNADVINSLIISSNGTINISPDVANKNISVSTTPSNTVTSVSEIKQTGVNLEFARGDHVHDLANGVVTEVKIATNAVTKDKIADGAVVEGKIESNAVTEAKIRDDAVKGAKIAVGAFTSTNGSIAIGRAASGAINLTTELSTGLEKLTTLRIDNWVHGQPMNLNTFLNEGLQVTFSEPVRLAGTNPRDSNEIFLVAAKIPTTNENFAIKTYHYEYLPGVVTIDDETAIFRIPSDLSDNYTKYFRFILDELKEQLIILVQLKCDFIIDKEGRAVDGHHTSFIGRSGLIWTDNGEYVGGIRGGIFESWFSIILSDRQLPRIEVSPVNVVFLGNRPVNVTVTGTNFDALEPFRIAVLRERTPNIPLIDQEIEALRDGTFKIAHDSQRLLMTARISSQQPEKQATRRMPVLPSVIKLEKSLFLAGMI